MGTRISHGNEQAPAAAQGGAHHLRNHDAVLQAGHSDAAELRRTLAVTERRLGAALRQLDRLRRQDALREQEMKLLAAAAEQARRFAYHDELTGLPNRHLLLDRFNQAVAVAKRYGQHVALLFFDLDRFKHINSTLGHSAGDKLLQEAAARLATYVRASDTTCRYGGDEFIVLLPEVNGKEGAAVVAENIRTLLAAPYVIDGTSVTMTTSVGMAIYSTDAQGCSDLIQVSDLAMYRDKAQGPAAPAISGHAWDVGKLNERWVSLLDQADGDNR